MTSVLLTDLYELTMPQAYFEQRMNGPAVFELFFVRKLPPHRNFLIAAGLEQVLDYLAELRFTSDDLASLRACGRFTPRSSTRCAICVSPETSTPWRRTPSATETLPGVPLLSPVVRDGRLIAVLPALSAIREHAGSELARRPPRLRALDDADAYAVEIAPALRQLAVEIDART